MLDKPYTIIAARETDQSALLERQLREKDVPGTTVTTNTVVATLGKIEELCNYTGMVIINPTMDLFYDDSEMGEKGSSLREAHSKNFKTHNPVQYFFMMLIDLCPQLLLEKNLHGTLHFLSLGQTEDIDREMIEAGKEIINVRIHTRATLLEILQSNSKLPEEPTSVETLDLLLLATSFIKK